MNTENLIPISYVKKFTPLVIGDEITNIGRSSSILINEDSVRMINELGGDWFVVSFADRTNTGEQPKIDLFVNVYTGVNSPKPANASDFQYWWTDGTIKSWKPNYDATLAKFKEQGANTMRQYNDQEAELATHFSGNNNRFYIRGHSMVKKAMVLNNDGHWIYGDCTRNDELDGGEFWKLDGKQVIEPWVVDHITDKPVFTQEMADAGELPPVGSKALLTCGGIFDKNLKEGDEVLIGGYADFGGGNVAVFCKERGNNTGTGVSNMFKPIDNRTDKEKTSCALWDCIEQNDGDLNESSIDAFRSDLLSKFTITLSK